MKNSCRICGSKNYIEAYYPNVVFNDKLFKYYSCKECKSYNVFPTPTPTDFGLMYGENNHSYLLNENPAANNHRPYSLHQRYQIQYLKKSKIKIKAKSLLDYGCGSGFYMDYANKQGAEVVGIEFDSEFASLIREKRGLTVFSLEEFKEKYKAKKFDIIHIGHVLEHIPNPSEIINLLKDYADINTIFLIDGPLDKNACLSRWIVDIFARLRRGRTRKMPPQHITLTNRKSQRLFFERNGFDILSFNINEIYFPFPDSLSRSLKGNIKFLLAFMSINLSKIIIPWGNVFHCKAKLK